MLNQTDTFAQKRRRGLNRVIHASGYSVEGLRQAWTETAFRQEVFLATVALPASLWVGRTWVEIALLCSVVMVVLIVELLNTAIESLTDKWGLEWHALSKRAKDTASAAVALSLVLATGVWAAALWHRFAV
jgi:diacylglycerol kinase (ATP)